MLQRIASPRRASRLGREQTQLEPEAGEDGDGRGGSQSGFHDSAGHDVASVACAPAARTAVERVAMS